MISRKFHTDVEVEVVNAWSSPTSPPISLQRFYRLRTTLDIGSGESDVSVRD